MSLKWVILRSNLQKSLASGGSGLRLRASAPRPPLPTVPRSPLSDPLPLLKFLDPPLHGLPIKLQNWWLQAQSEKLFVFYLFFASATNCRLHSYTRASSEKFPEGENAKKDRKLALLSLFQGGRGQRKKKRSKNST